MYSIWAGFLSTNNQTIEESQEEQPPKTDNKDQSPNIIQKKLDQVRA